MKTITAGSPRDRPGGVRRRALLLVGLLGGPVAWLVQFQANLTLVGLAQGSWRRWMVCVVPAVFLAVTCAAGAVAGGQWRGAARLDDPVAAERTRFLGIVGVTISALFFVLIVMQGAAALVFDPGEV